MFKASFDGVGKLVVYRDGVVLFEKTRDFEKLGIWKNGRVNGSGSDIIVSFNLSSAPKNARKVNLNRNDNFLVKYDAGVYIKERKTALYIHASEVSVENFGEFVSVEHDGEKDFLNAYKLVFNHGARVRVLRVEKLSVPGSWTIPEEERKAGAHWYSFLGDHNNSYETVNAEELKRINARRRALGLPEENYNLRHWFFEFQDVNENYYASDFLTRIEKDSARVDREKIAAALNTALGHDKLSHYDVDKLLKVVNITLK